MTTAAAPSAPATTPARAGPYVGLEPYGEQDADFFFGREEESRIVTANLRSSRLTVLYGTSGVGKSSLLSAGVIHGLRRRIEEGAARRRPAGARAPLAVALFRGWNEPALLSRVLETIRMGIVQGLGRELEPWQPGEPVLETLRGWTEDVGAVLVVLDQFEEYFIYHGAERPDVPGTFAAEFARLVEEPALRMNFLVSIREDALAKLDVFKGHIADVFSNYLRIEYMEPDAARRAIEQPIEVFNEREGGPAGDYEIEPELREAVLGELSAGRSGLADADGEPIAGKTSFGGEQIETPLLQIVMERLWEKTREGPDRVLRKQMLEDLGGTGKIVRGELERALSGLGGREARLAADAFRYLVTPSKTKIAQRASDLAYWSGHPEDEMEAVLEQLAGSRRGRLLRPLPPLPGETSPQYEIAHDVLADAILEWRQRYEQEREAEQLADEKVEAEQARHSAQMNRLVRGSAAILLLLVVALAIAVIVAMRAKDEARSRALAATALTQSDADPELALLLGLRAWDTGHSGTADQALRQAVSASRVRQRIPVVGPHADDLENDARDLSAIQFDHSVRVWDVLRGRWRPGPPIVPDGETGPTVWSENGNVLAVAGDRGVVVRTVRPAPATAELARGIPAQALSLSPDGRFLAIAADDGAVTVRNVSDDRVVARLPGTSHVKDLGFSPTDDGTLATASCTRRVQLWKWREGTDRVLRAPGAAADTCTVAFSDDGRRLASGEDEAVQVWDVARGRHVSTLSDYSDDPIDSYAWSPNNRDIAVQTSTSLRIYPDVSEPNEYPTSTDVTIPGTEESSSSSGGISAGDLIQTIFDFSPDGRRIAIGTRGGLVAIADARSGAVDLQLHGHGASIRNLGFLRGDRLLTTSDDATARIWDVGMPRELNKPRAPFHSDAVVSVAVTPDGRTVAIADAGGAVRLVSPDGRSPRRIETGMPYASSVAFADRGRVLVIGAMRPDVSDDGLVLLADAATGRITKRWTLRSQVWSAELVPGGRAILIGTGNGAPVWLDTSSKYVLPLPWPEGENALHTALSPDGRLAIAAGSDGIARVFDTRTRRQVAGFRSRGTLSGAVFSPDGKRVATFGADKLVHIWDMKTRGEILTMRGHANEVTSAAFSADAGRIVTGSTDRTVRIWDAANGKVLAIERPQNGSINDVTFMPGRRIAVLSASNDSTARLIECRTCGPIGDVAKLARTLVTRKLTDEEQRDFG